jgi:cell division protein FtsB
VRAPVYLKVSMFAILAGALAFLGFTGSQLLVQNRAFSEQVSELSAQVRSLQTSSEALQAQIEGVKKQLEPRIEPLLGHSR